MLTALYATALIIFGLAGSAGILALAGYATIAVLGG